MFGLPDMKSFMQMLNDMQGKMQEVQGELAKKNIEVSSGGGMVKVVINGNQEIQNIEIDPELIKSQDKEMIEDLVASAVNEGVRRAKEMMAEEISKLSGGLKIPGM